jgi:hypothetical protein
MFTVPLMHGGSGLRRIYRRWYFGRYVYVTECIMVEWPSIIATIYALLACCGYHQVRKFSAEQYATTGLELHAGHNPVSVSQGDDGKLVCTIRDNEGKLKEITGCDHVMMATGRAPKIDGLGLEEVGVKTGTRGTGVQGGSTRQLWCSLFFPNCTPQLLDATSWLHRAGTEDTLCRLVLA